MSLQDITIKRTRVPNFTVEEKNILTKLVNKRKDVIENKSTDTKSILKKKEAWLLIEKEFNCVINVYKRDHAVLKTAWDNIKAQTRRMQAAKTDVKSESKPPATSPIQKETILRMVEEIACNNTSEKSQEGKGELCTFIQKKWDNEAYINKTAPEFTHEVNNECDDRINENTDTCIEQTNIVPMNDQTAYLETNHLSFHIEVEPDDSSHIKTENSNGDTIEDIFTNMLHTTNNDDSIQLRADVLNSLQLQETYDVECKILQAKLQMALLEHQAAVINLEAVKLDLALKTKRLQ